MIYLGINSGWFTWHDPAACLIQDGKIISMVEEERFINIKHAPADFPVNAIKYCLSQAGIKITDVDKICYFLKPNFISSLTRGGLRRPLYMFGGAKFYYNTLNQVKSNLRHYFRVSPNVTYVDHHMAHAASTFYLSGFKKANIITIDGAGEKTCTMLAYGHDKGIEKIKEFYIMNSLGLFYLAFTKYLGFNYYDESKVMGLASYGKPQEFDFFKRNIIRLTKGGYQLDESVIGDDVPYTEKVVSMFGEPRMGGELNAKHENIAASLQESLEKTVVHLARFLYEQTGCKNLCLAGGVALNCKMNGILLQQDFVDDIYIQPAANDAGTSLGAAVKVAVEDGFDFEPMDHAYYGPSYTNEEIENVLKLAKVKYEYVDDVSGTTAELLNKDKIIGWFQGKMEWGPRALGARSIIASPKDPKMKDKINYYVKHREGFRPFCPSMLKGTEKDYLNGKIRDSPFMILAFDIKEEKRNEIPAVVHVDGTARVQAVDKKVNPLYYDTIKKFEDISGVPVILNTSFNDNKQPIVREPIQAVKMFFGTGMDYLVVGNYLLKKS